MAKKDTKPNKESGFWGGLGDAVSDSYETITDKLERIGNIPNNANRAAQRAYPKSARDASTKNAFRHALGTGMMANELGGGYVGSKIAKGMGYAWEGMGAMDFWNSEEHRNDTRHDLNANAIGAKAARNTIGNEELIKRLRARADNARTETPPSVYEPSPGYMTRSEK